MPFRVRIPRVAVLRRLLRGHPRLRRLLIGAAAVLALFLGVVVWLLFPYLRTFGDIGAGPENAPSRLYGAAPALRVGDEGTPETLAAELDGLGYRAYDGDALPNGRYRLQSGAGDDAVALRLRRHMTPQGPVPGGLLLFQFRKGKIAELREDGRPVERAELEPPVLATYYGDDSREKWPVNAKELPEPVIRAVLAAEDDAFYWHPGVSPTGIVRALFANLRHGEVKQGGSTLTQQLVKNVFLSSERSVFRKIREAVIAVAVEVQHSKRSILQGYLNGIYLGGSGGSSTTGSAQRRAPTSERTRPSSPSPRPRRSPG